MTYAHWIPTKELLVYEWLTLARSVAKFATYLFQQDFNYVMIVI